MLAGLVLAGGLCAAWIRHHERLAYYDERFGLPGFDAFVYAAMAEHPRFFTLPPWGYRVLTPALVHALPAPDLVHGFRWLTFGALGCSGVALYAFLRRLGHAEWPSLAAVAVFAFSPPVSEVVRHQFLVDPVGLLLLLAILIALQAGAGPGLLALLFAAGTLDKELFPLLVPGVFFALRPGGTRRALAATGAAGLAAALTSLALRVAWPPAGTPAAAAAFDADVAWLALWRVLEAWPEWWWPSLLWGVTPLALLGALRARARPYLARHGYMLALTSLLPFAAAVYTGDDVPAPFFADDVPRLLLYALPLLLPLALTCLAPPADPRPAVTWPRGREAACGAAAAVLALSPLAILDRYRRIDLRGPRDGALVFALCDQSLIAARRLERGRTVELDLDQMGFRHRRSDPRDLRRMRWPLREGWGPHPHYGMDAVEMQDVSASLLLPVLRPAELALAAWISAPQQTPLRLKVNGHVLAEWSVGGEARPERLLVPAATLFRGDNLLSLEAPGRAFRVRLHRVRLRQQGVDDARRSHPDAEAGAGARRASSG